MSDNQLDQYYVDLINIWDHGGSNGTNGGWAQYYYGIFSSIIRENNFTKCAEVGIGYGFHAKDILDNTNVEKLYLIDPMQFYPNDGFATDVLSYGGFDKLVRNINLHLAPYANRYTWFRQPSITITNDQIGDETLDAVFIDGDHSYEAVIEDLTFWWTKLRKGGMLLGDDYSGFVGVRTAVHEFSETNGIKYDFLTKNNYPIFRFIKN
jgi:hypothetical protein